MSETPPSEFDFDKNTGTIVKYLGYSKEITIPKKIQGVPVKIIGKSSFINIGVEKINIPFGIEGIEFGAFYDNKIEKLHLSESLKHLGDSVFKSNKPKEVYLLKSIYSVYSFYGLGRNAFDSDVKIKKKSFFNRIFW